MWKISESKFLQFPHCETSYHFSHFNTRYLFSWNKIDFISFYSASSQNSSFTKRQVREAETPSSTFVIVARTQCGNYWILLSRLFHKNTVKSTFSLVNLRGSLLSKLISRIIFQVRVIFCFFHTVARGTSLVNDFRVGFEIIYAKSFIKIKFF